MNGTARLGLVLLVAAVMCAPPRDACADDSARPKSSKPRNTKAHARTLLKQGFKLAKAWQTTKDPAKLKQALALFKRSFSVDATLKAECNIGIAYRDLDQLARAHLFLGNCINRLGASNPTNLAKIRQLQNSVEASLRRSGLLALEVRSTPSGARISVDSLAKDETFVAPRQIWLSEGTHTLTATMVGHVKTNATLAMTAARSRTPLILELEKTPPPKRAEPNKKPVRRVEPNKPLPSPPTQDRYLAPRGKLPVIVLSAGVAALAVGGIVHAVAFGTRTDLEGIQVGTTRTSTVNNFKRERILTIGLYAVGGLATAAGIYLYKRKRASKNRSNLTILPAVDTRHGAMLLVRGRM